MPLADYQCRSCSGTQEEIFLGMMPANWVPCRTCGEVATKLPAAPGLVGEKGPVRFRPDAVRKIQQETRRELAKGSLP